MDLLDSQLEDKLLGVVTLLRGVENRAVHQLA